jgi:integrase/recombinase XerD
MVYTFARVGAMVAMTVEDYYAQGKRSWLRLHEKGGKQHEMPAHHTLEEYLDAYIAAAGIAGNGKAPSSAPHRGPVQN